MERKLEERLMQRAVELGNSGQSDALPELLTLLRSPSGQVRRLAISAVGKLADVVDAAVAVAALLPYLHDGHPQVRQYAVKALSAYGAGAACALADLRDVAAGDGKEYNRRDAEKAITIISEAQRLATEQAAHQCQRCHTPVHADEYARSMKAFQRIYCDACFNAVYLTRRNFDTGVEINKTIPISDGNWVQSDGERVIAEYLHSQHIVYRYDERLQIIDGLAIRPDFYLPEFDLYIEYWGMNTTDYKIGMLKKQKLYQQQGKKLISLYYYDKHRLAQILAEKLSRYAIRSAAE